MAAAFTMVQTAPLYWHLRRSAAGGVSHVASVSTAVRPKIAANRFELVADFGNRMSEFWPAPESAPRLHVDFHPCRAR